MADIKQFNLRIDTETADKFRAFCESEGFNQAQGFGYMLEALELNKARTAIPSREKEITDFETHAKALVSAFLHSLEICENAENRAKDAFAEQLASKEKALAALSIRCEELEQWRNEAQTAAESAQAQIAKLETDQEQAQTIIRAHKGQLAAIQSQLDAAREAETRERSRGEALAMQLETAQAKASLADALEARATAAEDAAARAREELERMQSKLETAQARETANTQTIERLQAQLVQATSIDGLMERIGASQQLLNPTNQAKEGQGNNKQRCYT